MTMNVMAAYAWLLRATEPPVPGVAALVATHGAVEAVAQIRAGAASQEVMREVKRVDVDVAVRADLNAIATGALRLLTPDSDEWPTGPLQALSGALTPPLGLWVRGTPSLAALSERAVLVTGCSATDSYGASVACNFGYGLSEACLTVVSGASFGVDAEAHRGAMMGSAPTVAVVGPGVERDRLGGSVLRGHIVASGGLLVSEHPPGAELTRGRARARLRVLVALAQRTVLVDGIERGSAAEVARIADEIGRPVFAVPGPITSVSARLTNELLRLGKARVVTAPSQLLGSEEWRSSND